MYPNPQDAVPLPPQPDLEQYRKRAKELAKAARTGEDAIRAWAARWVETLLALQPDIPDFARNDAGRRIGQVTDFARDRLAADGSLSQAQFVIARALLDAGADVNAEADVYGRGATTLALAVTSSHPRGVGLQIPLADLLIERGARVDPDIVRYALVNGCPEAAAHLAGRGAPVDLESAAGIGRLEVVAESMGRRGGVGGPEAASALIMAAWYDQREAVALLLDLGVDVAARRPHEGSTALHVACYSGHRELVAMLLERGAPVDLTDAVYGTPPLVWAMHAWLAENRSNAEDYRAILRLLLAKGAQVRAEWLSDGRLREDRVLFASLTQRVRS